MLFKESFEEIEKEDKELVKKLSNFYSKHKRGKISETLLEHSNLVKKNFLKINKERNLESIYDYLIERITNKEKSKNIIKKAIAQAVFYHDIGKINPYFQKACAGKAVKKAKAVHSIYSYYLLLLKNSEWLEDLSKIENILILFIFKAVSYHHTSLEKFNINELGNDIENLGKDPILKEIQENNNLFMGKFIKKTNIYKIKKKIGKNENFFFLIKLFYSHLVLSDFYGTLEFTEKNQIEIAKIDGKLIKQMETSFLETKDYNQKLKEWKIKPIYQCSDINECRMNLLKQASETIKKLFLTNKRIFMLNVPTGGGKTNIAIRLMLDILNHNKKISKAFWVFPYINIIEQNFEVIKDTLSLNKDIIVKAHSNATKVINSETLLDEFNLFLDTALLNNPINVISNVNFFDTFIKARKYNRYKTASFVNSIVIIDEIQSLPMKNLDFFYKLIADLSKKYNMYFIIMSATLPNPNLFLKEKVPHLISNYKEYFHSKHLKRNSVKISSITKLEELKKEIKKKVERYDKILVVLNSIRLSIKFFEELKEELKHVNVFLLNSLTPIDERGKIIEFIKNTKEKVVLISTQSIEAGVDIDFDCGYRDYSPLDSIEQVCGRINRESDFNKRESSFLEVIKIKEGGFFSYKQVYKENPKLEVQNKDYHFIKHNIFKEQQKIINEKLFEKYYEEIKENISYNKKIDGELEKEYKKIRQLNFRELQEVNIIESFPQIEVYIERPIKKDEISKNLKRLGKELDFKGELFFEINKEEIIPILKNIKKLSKEIINKHQFLSKPYFKFVQSFIERFKIPITFYSNNPIEDTYQKLKDEKIITQEKIIKKDLTKQILKKYIVKDYTFYYVDINKIRDVIKHLNNKAESSFII